MSIKERKDSNYEELTRVYTPGDPLFYRVLRRPLEDLEERTNDLDFLMTPGRGLRIRQEIPASTNVECETGYYVYGVSPMYHALETIGPIAAAAGGNIRIDLIYLDPSTGTCVVVAGAEQAAAAGFAHTFTDHRPVLPADGLIPLAYLYIDDALAAGFDETVAINTAGHIRDARYAPGMTRHTYETSSAVFLADLSGGSVGTSKKVARADHRHPLNVDGIVPALLGAKPNGTGFPPTAGTTTIYCRSDHIHQLRVCTDPNELQKDHSGVAANIGTSLNLVRSNHSHPLNYDPALPVPVTVGRHKAAALGASEYYAAADHRHGLTGTKIVPIWTSVVFSNAPSGTVMSTPALTSPTGGLCVPRHMIFIATGELVTDTHEHFQASGFYTLNYGGSASQHGMTYNHYGGSGTLYQRQAAHTVLGENNNVIINFQGNLGANVPWVGSPGARCTGYFTVTAFAQTGISIRYTFGALGANVTAGIVMFLTCEET